MADPRTWRIAFAGGGTGGHLTPGLALFESAGAEGFADLVWFLAGRPIEARVLARVPESKAKRVTLDLERDGAPGAGQLVLRAAPAVRRARAALKESGCELLLGLGGAVTLPAVLAARSLRLPVALLETNAVPGKATKLLERFAELVFHGSAASLDAFGRRRARHVVTGLPICEVSSGGDRDGFLERFGFRPSRPLLLVLGGSQGALGLNRFLAEHASTLVESGVQVLHQVGPGRLSEAAEGVGAGYRAVEYLDPVAPALGAASFALCRGGAGTLAELAAAGLPALVVPYPHHADRHQRANALAFGPAFEVVEEEQLGPGVVQRLVNLTADRLGELGLRREAARGAASPEAAGRILDELGDLVAARRHRTR